MVLQKTANGSSAISPASVVATKDEHPRPVEIARTIPSVPIKSACLPAPVKTTMLAVVRGLLCIPMVAAGAALGAAVGVLHGLFYDHFFDHAHGDVVGYLPVHQQDGIPHPISAVCGALTGAVLGACACVGMLWRGPLEAAQFFATALAWHTHSGRNNCPVRN
jgi:hypothetical protein